MTSTITPGTYYIFNKALDVNGNKLAITFNSQNQTAVVQPLVNSSAQQWIVATSTASSNLRIIVPITSQGLQLGGGSAVSVVPGTGSVWVIQLIADGYTIRNSLNDVTTTWGINAVDGASITFAADTDIVQQRWIFQAVP